MGLLQQAQRLVPVRRGGHIVAAAQKLRDQLASASLDFDDHDAGLFVLFFAGFTDALKLLIAS